MFENSGHISIEREICYPNFYIATGYFRSCTDNSCLNMILKELSWFLRYENKEHNKFELKFI
jgi:hypothetical protein